MINRKANKVTPGSYLPRQKELLEKAKTDAIFKSPQFAENCEKLGLKVTRRQAVKYKLGKGLVFKSN